MSTMESSVTLGEMVHWARGFADLLESAYKRPYGPPVDPPTRQVAGQACLSLAGGDRAKARGLWQQIEQDCFGYMPQAAAIALVRSTSPRELMIETPVPS